MVGRVFCSSLHLTAFMLNQLLRFVTRMPYYAVANGRNVGIYSSWGECEQQVKGFPAAKFKKFNSQSEAQDFISAFNNSPRLPTAYTPVTRKLKSYTTQTRQYHRQKPAANRSTKLIQPVAQHQTNDEYVDVYTDGASAKNGRRGAAAGIGVYWGRNSQWNVSERLEGRQTNNRAEIHAAVKAISQASSRGIKKLRVYTDSQFLLNAYTKWLPGWKRNGWKLSTGGPVKNRADFERLEEAIADDMNVQFVHVKGHSGNVGNCEADKLAVEGSRKPYLYKMDDFDMDDDDDFAEIIDLTCD